MPKRIKQKPNAKPDQQSLFAMFVLLLNKGKTREEIVGEMGLNNHQFEQLFGKYYSGAEEDQQSKTPLRIFVEVLGRKAQLNRDLEELKDFLKKEKFKNSQAYVAAIRTQSDIIDSTIKLGQDLKLIVKAAEQLLFVGGRDTREMDEDELEMTVMQEMAQIQRMVKTGNKRKKATENVLFFPDLESQNKE